MSLNDRPLQNPLASCLDCVDFKTFLSVLEKFADDFVERELSVFEIYDEMKAKFPFKSIVILRNHCVKCGMRKDGTYKADLIICIAILLVMDRKKTAKLKQLRMKNLTAGRKPVLAKRFGKIILNLRKDGKTLQEIADILEISKPSVQKIINQFKSEGKL